jgi:hypothetical protein
VSVVRIALRAWDHAMRVHEARIVRQNTHESARVIRTMRNTEPEHCSSSMLLVAARRCMLSYTPATLPLRRPWNAVALEALEQPEGESRRSI